MRSLRLVQRASALAAGAALLLAVRGSAAPDPRFDGRGDAQASSAAEAAPVAPAAPKASEIDERLWVVLAAKDAAERSTVANAGVSIEELRPGTVGGFATPRALARAKAAGVRVISADPLSQKVSKLSFPSEDSAYHTYDQTVALLRELAAKAPDIASLYSIGTTTQGRQMWALRLCADAKGDAVSKLPGALFLGTHHAREHLSNEVPLLLAQKLVESRGDADVAKLLKGRDVIIVPMVNPDGAEYDVSGDKYHMHRKNMRDNGDGSLGVDLNRNYGFHWGEGGASEDTNDETYRGPSAFSEPETKAMKAFIEAHANVKVLISYHTFSELVLYPWGHTNDPIDDKGALAAYQAMAAEMGRMTGYTPEQSSALYIASGDLTDWSWGARGIYSFTFEMMPKSMWDGGFYPGPTAIASSVQANWRPMLYLIDLADDPARAGRGGASAFASVRTPEVVQ